MSWSYVSICFNKPKVKLYGCGEAHAHRGPERGMEGKSKRRDKKAESGEQEGGHCDNKRTNRLMQVSTCEQSISK